MHWRTIWVACLIGLVTNQSHARCTSVTTELKAANPENNVPVYTVTDDRTGNTISFVGVSHTFGDERKKLMDVLRTAPPGGEAAAISRFLADPVIARTASTVRNAVGHLVRTQPNWIGVEASPNEAERWDDSASESRRVDQAVRPFVDDGTFVRVMSAQHNTAAFPRRLQQQLGFFEHAKIVPIEPPLKDLGLAYIAGLAPRMKPSFLRDQLADAGLGRGEVQEAERLIKLPTLTPSQNQRYADINAKAKALGERADKLFHANMMLANGSSGLEAAVHLVATSSAGKAREVGMVETALKQRGRGSVVTGKVHTADLAKRYVARCNGQPTTGPTVEQAVVDLRRLGAYFGLTLPTGSDGGSGARAAR